ncbi:MAG TPA: amidohydrolase family protein [Phycisphaerales bacterium]|nr:amidohydrolase family protein [Phycisphaerales bacterium]
MPHPVRLGALTALLLAAAAQAQHASPLAPPANGPRRVDPTWLALSDCTVHVDADTVVPHATVIVRDGLIRAVLPGDNGPDGKPGTDDDAPARLPIGPRVIGLSGLHVYPAFIDPYVEVEAPKPDAKAPGQHWNTDVTPQRSALDGPGLDAGSAKSLRELGFAAAAVTPRGGVFRGRSAVVSLARAEEDASLARPPVYREDAYQSIAFDLSGPGYPNSLMGAIALIRQTLSDAQWQFGGEHPRGEDADVSCLRHLGPRALERTRLLFDSGDSLEALRAAKIAREFEEWGGKPNAVILGSGREFMRLDAIKRDALPFIIPLNFPKAPDVSSPGKAESTELRDMMIWEQAPTNPRRLAQAGAPIAFTTAKLKSRDDFRANLRKAIRHGLTEEQALSALTTAPASMLGVADQLGTIEPDKRANILVTTGPVFDKETKYRMILVDGKVHELEKEKPDLDGTWTLTDPGDGVARAFELEDGKVTLTKKEEGETRTVKARKVSQEGSVLSFVFDHDEFGEPGVAAATYVFDAGNSPSSFTGRVSLPGGTLFEVAGVRTPRTLKGEWEIFFGDGAAMSAGGVLRVTPGEKSDAPTVKLVRMNDQGVETVSDARDVAWDGKTLEFNVTSADGPWQDARIRAAIDWEKKPPAMTGSVMGEEGSRPFAARRAETEQWWTGTWRVYRFMGKDKDPAAPDQVELVIEKNDLTVVFKEKGKDDIRIDADAFKVEGNVITFAHDLKPLGGEGKSTDKLTRIGGELRGVATEPDGSSHDYHLRRVLDQKKDDEEAPTDIPEKLPTPFGPYGLDAVPAQGSFVITNATLWTNTDRGIIENGWIAIADGKIVGLGSGDFGIDMPSPPVHIDAEGKHITPGVIDAHSHTGISRGVNEGGQAITAEVRIADVTNPDDVDWYRQLAGGVTAVLQLHGSANAIGGQSQTTKLRWGCAHPDDMHFEGAIAGIKFALGENPRQVNWSNNNPRERYPQTRMGVETLIRDRFTAAREYAEWMRSDDAAARPRRDLELEAIAEILAGERLVHCHSYRQDEIVMLTQVARDFNFKIGTFQHILEGYKVADYVRDYSGGGSGFTDWWAYKMEVQDAIPAGLPLMHRVGVTTSFNSDSNNLARLLNVEAGKAVKYGRLVGGIPPEEALHFVTLAPAKQLRVEKRVGTLEAGKDADIAVWSGVPLSAYSKCERTFVDGRELFSLEQDAKHRERIRAERRRLIDKLLEHKKHEDKNKSDEKREKTGAPDKSEEPGAPTHLSEAEIELQRFRNLEMLRSGRDPFFAPGVCGCDICR